MPYNKRKQKCKQSDGDAGSYVLSYTDKKGKKHRACHTSKKKMQGQIAAIEAEADEASGETLQENQRMLRLTRRQLRLLIREACGLAAEEPSPMQAVPAGHAAPSDEVPVPEDYDAVRSMLEQNPDIVDLGISMVMDLAGTSCERSTAQGIIDHLQKMTAHSAQPIPVAAL